MTLGFSELAVGDSVELKGPIGHFIWKGMGVALCHGEEKLVREIGLLCAGSGITVRTSSSPKISVPDRSNQPILQVLRGILNDPLHHDTKIWLLYVNRYLEDILCREELHQLAEAHKHRCRLHHTLTGSPVPPGWEYSTGRVNDEMLKYHLPTPGENKLVCICGPSAMEQSTKGLQCSLLRRSSAANTLCRSTPSTGVGDFDSDCHLLKRKIVHDLGVEMFVKRYVNFIWNTLGIVIINRCEAHANKRSPWIYLQNISQNIQDLEMKRTRIHIGV